MRRLCASALALVCASVSACSGGGTSRDGGDAQAARDTGSEGGSETSARDTAAETSAMDGPIEALPSDAQVEAGSSTDGAADAADADARPSQLARLEVRVGATMVPADGYSWIPMLVIGTNADGTPATDAITLSLSREDGGILRPRAFTLDPLGSHPFFIPCSYADTGCVGTVKIRGALTSAPDVILAESQEITMVAPDGLGSPAACLVAANAFFFDGNDYIFQGTMTVTDGTFMDASSTDTHVAIQVLPLLTSQGSNWQFDFSSAKLGQPLREQVYQGAQRYPFEAMTKPGIDISGSGRGCNMIAGDFQIQKLVWENAKLRELIAVFDQHCEAGVTSLRGCIHFTAP